jgi:exosortase A-associated hydrolase 2
MVTQFFLPGANGSLHCVLFSRADGEGGSKSILLVPPFGEEMNKTRRMMARLGYAAATLGFSVLLVDLYGTGDSDGDFGDAEWERWRRDLESAGEWLRGHGCDHLVIVGVRAGCLLALDSVGELALAPSALLFWQPVLSGREVLTQMLRLRVAASLTKGTVAETVSGLRARLSAGESVEVAGYDLAPALALPLDHLVLKDLLAAVNVATYWIDVAPDVSRPPPPAMAAVLRYAVDQGLPVRYHRLEGEAFWATQELVDVPTLIDVSTRLLAEVG